MASTALRPRERDALTQSRHSGVTPRLPNLGHAGAMVHPLVVTHADLPPGCHLHAELMENPAVHTRRKDILHGKHQTLSQRLT